jgi:hypothetical protein
MSYLHHIAHCQSLKAKPLTYVQWLRLIDSL